MYPYFVIVGAAVLLIALLGGAVAIVISRATRPPAAPFAEEFIGQLNQLEHVPVLPRPSNNVAGRNDAHSLHKQGEPAFRIASKLGIAKADAELLIRIGDALDRTDLEAKRS